jgi:uncharacterized protein (TIGR03437 family)
MCPQRRFGLLCVTAALLMCCAASATAQNLEAPSIPRAMRSLTLNQSRYRLRAGESTRLDASPETLDFLLHAKTRSLEIDGKEARGVAVGTNRAEDQVLLAASLRTKPGEYTVKLSAITETSEERVTTLAVTLDPMQTVPSTATQPPVVLLNGWQFGINLDSLNFAGCPVSSSSSVTFGNLEEYLYMDGVPVVYFFDNCVEDLNGQIEDLGNVLGQVLGLIRYDTGALVPQVDLVAHSMGGLIARSYLSGLQDGGSLQPPVNPRIRKLVLIATPNFGSFLAENWASSIPAGTQSAEMIPGSAFLWDLATWNQQGDDLRGVDALAIAGDATCCDLGSWYLPSDWFEPADLPNAGDGVVSLSSASLGFSRDQSRTRILHYCHEDLIPGCSGAGIANVNEAPETALIIESFLANTPNWMSIGGTPATDPYLSQYGGAYFAVETAADQYLSDLNPLSVFFGTTELNNGGWADTVFYNELVPAGMGSFQASSASLNQITYGPVTIPTGGYMAFRAKFSPAISSVTPLLANVPGWVVQSGTTITINGVGFGSQRCSGCTVIVTPSGSINGYALPVSSWTNSAITASFSPASMPSLTIPGLVTVYVELSSSAWDSINIMAAPAVPGLSIAKTHTGSFARGQAGATYTVTVSNAASGGPTSGTVTVTEAPPSGLTLVSMAGTGWTCPAGGTTCTRSDVLAAGSSYPAITVTVNVAANSTSPQVNTVAVSGGGASTSQATDSTNIEVFAISGPASLPAGQVGVAYAATAVTATGGSGSYAWSATGLPAGLGIGSATGVISGTPTTNSGSPYTVQVTVTDGNSAKATRAYSLTISAASANSPLIGGVLNAASGQATIAPNTWVSIYGSNFAAAGFTDDWSKSIVNGNLPTTLDGVSVSVGGTPAYVSFVSPGQINVLTPNVASGNASVTVTAGGATTAPATVTAQPFSPAFFPWPNGQPVATHLDYSWAVKNGTFAGATTVPAKPGEYIILWGTGFGPTTPAAPAGVTIPAGATYYAANPVSVTIGNLNAPVYATALAPGFAGLYQVVVTVPATLSNGDYALVATVGGVATATTTLTVQN